MTVIYCSRVDIKPHFVSISSHRKSGGAKAPLAPPLSTPLCSNMHEATGREKESSGCSLHQSKVWAAITSMYAMQKIAILTILSDFPFPFFVPVPVPTFRDFHLPDFERRPHLQSVPLAVGRVGGVERMRPHPFYILLS